MKSINFIIDNPFEVVAPRTGVRGLKRKSYRRALQNILHQIRRTSDMAQKAWKKYLTEDEYNSLPPEGQTQASIGRSICRRCAPR